MDGRTNTRTDKRTDGRSDYIMPQILFGGIKMSISYQRLHMYQESISYLMVWPAGYVDKVVEAMCKDVAMVSLVTVGWYNKGQGFETVKNTFMMISELWNLALI